MDRSIKKFNIYIDKNSVCFTDINSYKVMVIRNVKHTFIIYNGIPCIFLYNGSLNVLKLKLLGVSIGKPVDTASVLFENGEIASSLSEVSDAILGMLRGC